MKEKWLIWTLCIIIFISCKKEKFPDIDEITGSWIEETDQPFKYKLIFEKETLFFVRQNQMDTFSYHLDKKQELIFLSSSAGVSNHKILLNKKEKILTIWGLFQSTPENISEKLFNKE